MNCSGLFHISLDFQIERMEEIYKEAIMEKQVYNVRDIQGLLGVSESKAYQYIRVMNDELQEKGFLVVRGKVPRAYVEERFFGMKGQAQEDIERIGK